MLTLPHMLIYGFSLFQVLMHSQFTQSRERGRETDDYVTYHVTDMRYRLLNKTMWCAFCEHRHAPTLVSQEQLDGWVILRSNLIEISHMRI